MYFGIPIAEDWCINVQMGIALYVYQACWLENFANIQLNMRRIEVFKKARRTEIKAAALNDWTIDRFNQH